MILLAVNIENKEKNGPSYGINLFEEIIKTVKVPITTIIFKETTKRKLFDHFCDTENCFATFNKEATQFTICIIKQLGGVVCTLNQIYSHSRSGNASFQICNNKRLK